MRKFDFIRFGECVQWKDNLTNTYRTMQVCTPFKQPVNGKTIITLIPFDERNEDENICNSYSVQAEELIPVTTPFSEGYWYALQAAFEAGADTPVISAMLRTANLTYEECLLHIQYSDTYKDELRTIVISLFPEESKTTSPIFQITWNGKEYPAKSLTIFKGTEKEEAVTVSVLNLQRELINEKTGANISVDAEELDGEIYFYLSNEEMNLSDIEIITIVEKA